MEDVLTLANKDDTYDALFGIRRRDKYGELSKNLFRVQEELRIRQNSKRRTKYRGTFIQRMSQRIHNFTNGIRDWSWRTWLKLLFIFFIIVAAVLCFVFLRRYIVFYMSFFLEWVRDQGIYGALTFIGVYAISTVFFVPGTILTIAAGFIYGIMRGFPIISVGSLLGASMSFLLGRSLLRGPIKRRIQQNPKFNAIDKAIAVDGWKVVLLLRLTPLLPFNLLNYALALTSVTFSAYVQASWVGMTPGIILFLYIGTTVMDFADIITNKASENSLGMRIALLLSSGVLIICIFSFLLVVARRAINNYIKDGLCEGTGYVFETNDGNFIPRQKDEEESVAWVSTRQN
ncbi:hypothetical protein AKO1_014601 [Acrasis kona]|uniref:VTT domain-containing protein n=1 Tax=Acrasis kona TaxID=1008807 RepID=A0AAW2Z0S9_9EUKA